MAGPLVFIFLLAKGLSGKTFTKEASLYLIVSAGLLAILLTASHQFSWLDVLVSTAATLPVGLGMYVGQHMRDKIAAQTFPEAGVARGHCRRRRSAATWLLQLTGWPAPLQLVVGCRRNVAKLRRRRRRAVTPAAEQRARLTCKKAA